MKLVTDSIAMFVGEYEPNEECLLTTEFANR